MGEFRLKFSKGTAAFSKKRKRAPFKLCLNHKESRTTCTRGRGGIPPFNTTECFLKGPGAWGWLLFGLLCRLWLWPFRVCGGFVCSCRCSPSGVGRSACLWFRFSSMLIVLRVWRFRFIFSMARRRVLVDPGRKLRS